MWRILIILIFKIKLIKEIKMIFGILKPNRAVTEVERIFINVAHEHGHEAYIFTAADVDFENKKILRVNGSSIENFAEMLDKLYEKAYKNDSDGVHEIIMKMTNS